MSTDISSIDQLKSVASACRRMNVPSPNADLRYDVMADSVYWTDEVPSPLPFEWDVMRFITHHRTRLILGEGESPYTELWNRAKELFPEWVGFRADRCLPSSEVVLFYRRYHK